MRVCRKPIPLCTENALPCPKMRVCSLSKPGSRPAPLRSGGQNAGLSKTDPSLHGKRPPVSQNEGLSKHYAPDFSTNPHFGTRFFDKPAFLDRMERFAFDNPAFLDRRATKTCAGALFFDKPAFLDGSRGLDRRRRAPLPPRVVWPAACRRFSKQRVLEDLVLNA
jgi:hypothetical protein